MPDLASIVDRVGSVFRQDYDTEKERQKLYEELRSIAALKGLVATEGWQQLNAWIKGRITDYDRDIISLSANMVRNQHEIIAKIALRTAMADILRIVDNTLMEEKGKSEELSKLEEITREVRAS